MMTGADRLRQVAQLARSFVGENELETALTRVTAALRSLRPDAVCAIRLVDPAAGGYRLAATEGFPATGRMPVVPFGEGLTHVVAETRRPLLVGNNQRDPRAIPGHWSAVPGLTTYYGVPIDAAGELLGVINMNFPPDMPPTEDEQASIDLLATQAALAFHNAQVLKESTARQAQLEALLEVTRELSAIQSVESLLGMIAETCGRLLDSESVGFRLLEDDELVVTGKWGDAGSIMNTQRLKIGESLSGTVAVTGEPLSVTDVANDPRVIPAHREALRRAGYKRWLGMPVKIGGRLVGVLSIRTRRDQDFSEGDLAIAAAFASHAAITIENARLYDAITGTNARLQEQATALEAKNAELDSFAYSVSHDLKSPLVTIEGIAGILLEDYGSLLDEAGIRYLRRLQANVQQMERLIGDLLALSRIGREARPPEVVNLADLVDGLQAELAGLIQARGIKVSMREAVDLWGIRTQIEQVFSNLLSNAIKYAGETTSPSVEIGAIDRGDLIECYVRDNGIGIDPAYHSKIFEIFQRLKDVEAEGTGVGLAIVKRIVEAAGGRIWVESARGQGAAFYFTWPKSGAKARAGGSAT